MVKANRTKIQTNLYFLKKIHHEHKRYNTPSPQFRGDVYPLEINERWKGNREGGLPNRICREQIHRSGKVN